MGDRWRTVTVWEQEADAKAYAEYIRSHFKNRQMAEKVAVEPYDYKYAITLPQPTLKKTPRPSKRLYAYHNGRNFNFHSVEGCAIQVTTMEEVNAGLTTPTL